MFSFLVPSAPPTDLSAITPNATTLDITWQPPGLAHQNVRVYLLCMGAQQCLVPSVYLYMYMHLLY